MTVLVKHATPAKSAPLAYITLGRDFTPISKCGSLKEDTAVAELTTFFEVAEPPKAAAIGELTSGIKTTICSEHTFRTEFTPLTEHGTSTKGTVIVEGTGAAEGTGVVEVTALSELAEVSEGAVRAKSGVLSKDTVVWKYQPRAGYHNHAVVALRTALNPTRADPNVVKLFLRYFMHFSSPLI